MSARHFVFSYICLFIASWTSIVKASDDEPLSQIWKYHKDPNDPTETRNRLINIAYRFRSHVFLEVPDVGKTGPIRETLTKKLLVAEWLGGGSKVNFEGADVNGNYNGPYGDRELWHIKGK